MITIGDRLNIKTICPDCQQPMGILEKHAYGGISYGDDSAFSCVVCGTPDCINQGFASTIEKKSGKVIYTNANYVFESSTNEWKPIYPQYVNRHGEKIK